MRAILQELVYDSPVGGAVWPFDREYIRPPHFHGQVELLLIRCGAANVHVGGRVERLRAGQVCWILPCLPHVMSGFSPDFDMWVIELEAPIVGACWRAVTGGAGAAASEAFEGVASLGEQMAGRLVADVPRDEARRMSELALRVWGAPSATGVRETLRILCELALRVTIPGVGPRRASSLTDLASCLLLASPLLGRRSLAADLGVSEGFLSRSFGHDLGVSFVEHRARSRLARFLALVQGGNRNLLDTALAAGFGSYSQFHRVFTRVSGVRPRDYSRVADTACSFSSPATTIDPKRRRRDGSLPGSVTARPSSSNETPAPLPVRRAIATRRVFVKAVNFSVFLRCTAGGRMALCSQRELAPSLVRWWSASRCWRRPKVGLRSPSSR